MVHQNLNVMDLDKSIEFYNNALNLSEIRRIEAQDKSFIIVYLGNDQADFELELTWIKDRKTPYNLGDNEFHLAFTTKDFDKAYSKHKNMNCICYENHEMGIYFISDPDGYWLEVIPEK